MKHNSSAHCDTLTPARVHATCAESNGSIYRFAADDCPMMNRVTHRENTRRKSLQREARIYFSSTVDYFSHHDDSRRVRRNLRSMCTLEVKMRREELKEHKPKKDGERKKEGEGSETENTNDWLPLHLERSRAAAN